jgi:hypothetical protein
MQNEVFFWPLENSIHNKLNGSKPFLIMSLHEELNQMNNKKSQQIGEWIYKLNNNSGPYLNN